MAYKIGKISIDRKEKSRRSQRYWIRELLRRERVSNKACQTRIADKYKKTFHKRHTHPSQPVHKKT